MTRSTTAAGRLTLAAASEPLVDFDKRTIAGLIVPFGKEGQTSGGRLRFAAGTLKITRASRVKLLREHDQNDPVGVGLSFEELTAAEVDERLTAAGKDPLGVAGVWGVYKVPPGHNGDRALQEAADELRDGFSVGVQLDENTMTRLRRSQGAAVDAAGALRETSLVTVPAFEDTAAVAAGAGGLVVSTWSTSHTPDSHPAAAGGTTTTGGNMFTEAQRRRRTELLAKGSLSDVEASELDQLTAAMTAARDLLDEALAGSEPAEPAADAAQASAAVTGPSVVPAVAGAAVVTSEPATYNFSSGHSIVGDLFRGAMMRDSEAQERVDRFNAELLDGNPASVAAFTTAAATRDNVDGTGTDLPSFFSPNPNRPDLMRALVDVKRPFVSRLQRIPINNAQPFAIPKVGKFEGVGPHTEGTPHRPAGTLTLGGGTVQPTASSGAWEVSRELLDAATPALDRIAAREMLRDYQRQTEGKVIDLVAAHAAAFAADIVHGVTTALDFRDALMDFVNDDDEAADLAIIGKEMLRTLGQDVDNADRAQLPFIGHTNALGGIKAGHTGLTIDGVEITRSARLDGGVGAGIGVLARSEGILWAESNVLQFRFDEVLGPGVIKLALWAYNAAAILDSDDVRLVSTGAANAVDADPAS